jgi:hypothetical protein
MRVALPAGRVPGAPGQSSAADWELPRARLAVDLNLLSQVRFPLPAT